jgi:hypothetical protein
MDGAARGLRDFWPRALLAGLVLMTAGCGVVYMPGSNHRSDVLEKMSAERQKPRPSLIDPPETLESDEARLQSAAFSLLAGKSSPEAVAFLEDDGWDCAGLTCRTMTIRQELPYTFGVRTPGPPRRFTTIWQLTLPPGRIAVPTNIRSARETLVEDAQ